MTDHNPHRIALVAAIGSVEAERETASGGNERAPFLRILRHLTAALTAGDEAADAEPEQELTTQAELDERRDARWALAELRLGLARALGRRTREGGIAAVFGQGAERISTPNDDVLIDDVRTERTSARALRKRLAELLGIRGGSTNDGRLLAAVERAVVHAGFRRDVEAALGYPEDDEPDTEDVLGAIATTQQTAARQRDRADRLHRALAVFAGYEPDVRRDPEALFAALTDEAMRDGGPTRANRDAAIAELSDPATDTPED